MRKILILFLASVIYCKTCLETYSCFNSETQCKNEVSQCINDQSCLQILSSPDSCLYDCTKDCLKNPALPFPKSCFDKCIPEKQNKKYSNMMNCKIRACSDSVSFLENNRLNFLSNDECSGITGEWRGTITYNSFTDHWIFGCTAETIFTVIGSDSKFFFTMDVKCPGKINGEIGPYCNSYCNEGSVKKIGSCSEGMVNIPYFSGLRIGNTMVLISQEGTLLETRIQLDK